MILRDSGVLPTAGKPCDRKFLDFAKRVITGRLSKEAGEFKRR